MMTSGVCPISRRASAPPSTPTSRGSHLAEVPAAAEGVEVVLVLGAPHHDEDVAVLHLEVDLGDVGLVEEEVPLLAEVGEGVLGEALELLAHRLPGRLDAILEQLHALAGAAGRRWRRRRARRRR